MQETRVLYNNTCPVCSFEIDAYRKRAEASALPIRFDALSDAATWRLTPDQAARRLHVLQHGKLLSGIPAFRALLGGNPAPAVVGTPDGATVHRRGGCHAV